MSEAVVLAFGCSGKPCAARSEAGVGPLFAHDNRQKPVARQIRHSHAGDARFMRFRIQCPCTGSLVECAIPFQAENKCPLLDDREVGEVIMPIPDEYDPSRVTAGGGSLHGPLAGPAQQFRASTSLVRHARRVLQPLQTNGR